MQAGYSVNDSSIQENILGFELLQPVEVAITGLLRRGPFVSWRAPYGRSTSQD